MHVNVVTVRSGWILQKIAERIVDAGNTAELGKFSLSHLPINEADVNFYCDVQNCYFGKTKTLDMGLFTHIHANDIKTVNPITYTLDFIFHMSSRYLDMFHLNKLYPHGKMLTMLPWEMLSSFELKKPSLGIFQRGKYEGKGFYRMLDIMEWDIAKRFHFVFVGNDWEDVVDKGKNNGVSCVQHCDSQVKYPEGYNQLYNSIDYLLIPSKWEGGPICALEAASKGIPIISADVGWVHELVSFAQIFMNEEELRGIFGKIISELFIRRSYVYPIKYKTCAKQIIEVANIL